MSANKNGWRKKLLECISDVFMLLEHSRSGFGSIATGYVVSCLCCCCCCLNDSAVAVVAASFVAVGCRLFVAIVSRLDVVVETEEVHISFCHMPHVGHV